MILFKKYNMAAKTIPTTYCSTGLKENQNKMNEQTAGS
jgi:hypothetical protein